jgi:hypothetical protein
MKPLKFRFGIRGIRGLAENDASFGSMFGFLGVSARWGIGGWTLSRAAGTLGSSQSGIRSPEDSSVSPGCRRDLSTRCEWFEVHGSETCSCAA